MKREYEEFKVRINVLVAESQKKPEEGWVLQDGTPWPRNNTDNHPGMIQVCLRSALAVDNEGKSLPRLVYVSREKCSGYQHHNKAGAMNSLLRVSAVLSNVPFVLNLDCDQYINNIIINIIMTLTLISDMCLSIHLDTKIEETCLFVCGITKVK
ncbi:unnamed protein product [Lathyrus sativus]|nr:unnamed protein product [Lathyrus sativus]